MKAFSCGAVVPGCAATFTTDTEDQMLACVADHARKDHAMTSISPEVIAQVRAHIRDSEV